MRPDQATLEMVMVFSFPLTPWRSIVLRHWYWRGGRLFTLRVET